MKKRWKPAWAILGLTAGLTGLVGTSPAKAQAWADNNYAYRRSLTITNDSAFSVATGNIVAYSFVGGAGVFTEKSRADGKDVKIFYYNGSSNVNVPQKMLSMGTGAAKILFEAQAPIPSPPPYLTVNPSAGTTDWNTILAATPESTRVTFSRPAYDGGAADDADTNVTLPFAFPFRNGTSTTLGIGVDGFVEPGGYDPDTTYLRYSGGIDDPAKFAVAYVVSPWCADLGIYPDAGFPGRGVFYTADATRAIVRWCTTDTGGSAALEMNFACIIKPDGTIRFVYGPRCDAVAGQTMKIGVGAGDASLSSVTTSTTAYGGNTDILYTQTFGATQSTGYWLYYGNTLDDGKTGRVAPSATNLVYYDFDDDTTQGWVKASANTETPTVEAVTYNGEKALHVQTTSGGHPQAYASGQTTLLGDSVVYAKLACAGSDEIGIGARCSDSGTGYYNVLDGFGSQQVIVQRATPANYDIVSNQGTTFITSGWVYDVLSVTGTGESIALKGRAWLSGDPDPVTWAVLGAPTAAGRFDTGQLGLTGYHADKYIDWVCAASATAEMTGALTGATDELNPTIGIVKGTVSDKFSHKPLPGMKVVLTNASGLYVAETATDTNGKYAITLAGGGTYTVGTLGNGLSARETVSVSGGTILIKNFVPVVVANGDCEIPTADNTQPDQWEHYWFGTAPAFYGLSNEQNHTPGGHWSMKVSGATADSTSVQTGIGRTGNQLYQHPIVTGCSYTLGFWVYFTQTGGTVRFRLRNGWPATSPVIKAGAAPDPLNENKGGLVNGLVPVGQWYEVKCTWPFVVGGAANPLPIEYGLYVQGASGAGDVYFDDVTLTPDTSKLNMVIASVVDDQGTPIPSPYLGEMRYGGKMFANAAPGMPNGMGYFYTSTTTPITLAAWQGPLNRVATNIDPIGALVGITNATPVPYDPNLATPTATVVVTRKAANILSTGNGTVGLLNGTSQWSAYLIDKRIDKTGVTDPGDSTNPADWVQIRRNSTGDDSSVDGQAKVARMWDGNLDGEWNGLGTGGMRGKLSKDTGTDIPDRYRTTTFDIDLGGTWPIDQLEFAYYFQVSKHRVWISDTPFEWNVELPDSQAVLDTTTDATSVASQGFPSSNMPYAQNQAGPYQIYRFLTPITGRYLRIRQDGAPYGDGHQINLEIRAMSKAAFPAPITGRVINEAGQPVEGAFVGPFPKGAADNFVKTGADGKFTWSGPGVPTQLGVHIEAKSGTAYVPTPYLMAGPFTVVPAVGATMGDIVVHPSNGNALVGATNVFITNEGALGTEDYQPGFCDPSYAANPVSKLTDQLAGDTNQWVAKPSDKDGNLCPGDVSIGASYLRMGVESTLATPADLSEIDIYWFQNGFPPAFYVQVTKDGGTTWTTVFNTNNYAGNYNDAAPGDGLKVTPIKFATITGVQKIRVIFASMSNRDDAGNVFIINEIVALKAKAAAPVAGDIAKALQIAAGLLSVPPAASDEFARLNVVNTGSSAGKIDILDAVSLAKTVPH